MKILLLCLSASIGTVGAVARAFASTPAEQADGFLRRGIAAEARNDGHAASKCYELALRIDPSFKPAQERLAVLVKKAADDPLSTQVRIVAWDRLPLSKIVKQIEGVLGLECIGAPPRLEIRQAGGTLASTRVDFGRSLSGSLKEVLDRICPLAGASYALEPGTIVIFPGHLKTPPPGPNSPATEPKAPISPTGGGAVAGPAAPVRPAAPSVKVAGASTPDGSTTVLPGPAMKLSASIPPAGVPLEAMSDGYVPSSSDDGTRPAFTLTSKGGSYNWVQCDFAEAQTVSGCRVYWRAERAPGKPSMAARLPEWWKVFFLSDAGLWLPVSQQPESASPDRWDEVAFSPVKTRGLRIAVQAASMGTCGIHEWQVLTTAAPARPWIARAELPLDELIPFNISTGAVMFRVNKYSEAEEKKGMQVLLHGERCRKFLFAHAPSSATYTVPPGYTRFSAVGIGPIARDGTGTYSWSYRLLADGISIFQSPALSSVPNYELPMEVDLPPGTKTLTLTIDNNGSTTSNQSIWAEPKLLMPKTSTPVAARLEALRNTLRSTLENQVEGRFRQTVDDLRVKYLAALEKRSAEATKAGDAAAAAAFAAEVGRLKSGSGVPADDPADTLPALAALRKTWRSGLAAAVAAKATQSATLYDQCDSALAALAKSTTAPADAAAIGAARAEIAAARPTTPVATAKSSPLPPASPPASPPLPPAASPPASPPPAAPPTPNAPSESSMATLRRAVEKMVTLFPNGVKLNVDRRIVDQTGLPLPAKRFDIESLYFIGGPAKQIVDADIDALSACRGIQSLGLADTSITRLDGIGSLNDLKMLHLTSTAIADSALTALTKMRALKELALTNTRITGTAIATLGGIPSLEVLHLNQTGLTDADLAGLKPLRNLTLLNLGDTKVTGAGLAAIGGLTKLNHLMLDGLDLSGGDCAALAGCRSLTQLQLSRCKLSAAQLAQIAGLTSLTRLSLAGVTVDGVPLTDAQLASFATLTRLADLDVSNAAVTGTGFAALSRCRDLTVLALLGSTAPSSDGLLVLLRTFPRLNELHLSGSFNADAIAAIGQQHSLRRLSLTGDTKDDAFMALPTIKSLTMLDLVLPGLTDASAATVVRQPNLGRLYVNDTQMTDAALNDFARLKNLTELVVGNSAFTPAAIDKFRKALPRVNVHK